MSAIIIAGVTCSPEPFKPPFYGTTLRHERKEIPRCARNTTKLWCIEDADYPLHEVQKSLDQHYQTVASLFKEALIDTASSVNELTKLTDEAYLCPSTPSYIQPLRAVNADGKWRIVVNRVESYGTQYSQTVRTEECEIVVGSSCPLVPNCYNSKCVQKFIFQRFMVYDPYDYTFPFAIEKFKLPSSCDCAVGAFHL